MNCVDLENEGFVAIIDGFINGHELLLDDFEKLRDDDISRISSHKILKTEDGGTNIEMPIEPDEILRSEKIRECKKSFENIMTDLINKNAVFNITESLHIGRFQRLVNHFFNDQIRKYLIFKNPTLSENDNKKKKEINKKDKKQEEIKKSSFNQITKDDIIFIYKGGSVMQLIYGKNREFFNKSDLDEFICSIRDKFQRSDSDYSILINPNMTNELWTEIYHDMNIITKNVLYEIRNFLVEHNNNILPLYNINNQNLYSVINDLKETLHNIRTKTELQLCREDYRSINEFIGVRYSPNLTEYNNYFFKDSQEIFDEIPLGNPDFYDLPHIMSNRYKNQFIGTKEPILTKNNTFITYLNDVDNNNINISSQNYELSPIRYSWNEALEFGDSGFTLQRLKLNFGVYYITAFLPQRKLGYMEIPSELIDVSIPKKDDTPLNLVFRHIDYELRLYKSCKSILIDGLNRKIDYDFKSYTIYGFINDLLVMIFPNERFPWQGNPKFLKRVRRVLFVIFIELSSTLYSPELTRELTQRIYNIFNTFNLREVNNQDNFGRNNEFIENLNLIIEIINNHNRELDHLYIPSLLGEFLIKMRDTYNRIYDIENAWNRRINLNYYFKLCKDISELFLILNKFFTKNEKIDYPEPVMINDDAELINNKYYQKYLKYKSKYLNLRNKLN
jgi:hypothetical protein